MPKRSGKRRCCANVILGIAVSPPQQSIDEIQIRPFGRYVQIMHRDARSGSSAATLPCAQMMLDNGADEV